MTPARVVLALLLAVTGGAAAPAAETISIEAADGFELAASFWPRSGSAPAILLLHQCDSDRGSLADLGEALSTAGFRVLLPDLRGRGESKGHGFDLDADASPEAWERARPRHAEDAEAAYQELLARGGPDSGVIGILGASCSGSEVLSLAAAHPELSRLGFLSARLSQTQTRDAMLLRDRQLLFVVAKGDRGANQPAAQLAYRRRDATTLFLHEGEAHGAALLEQHPELVARIAAWYREGVE